MSVSLSHVFERTAQRFGVTLDQMRGVSAKAHEAQLAFCYLARGLTGAGELTIGMKIARSADWVASALEEAAHRLSAESRVYAETVAEIEIECLVEAGVADRVLFPLPQLSDPESIAHRLIGSPREAIQVGLADLQSLGAAYLALAAERAPIKAPPPDPAIARLGQAVIAFQEAARAAEQARFTKSERGAIVAREDAFQNLLKLIGAHYGKAQQDSRVQCPRAAIGR